MRTYGSDTPPAQRPPFQGSCPADREIDDAFERLLAPRTHIGARALQVVIPGDSLGDDVDRVAQWMAGLVSDFEDIDALLEGLGETSPTDPATVPSATLATLPDSSEDIPEAQLIEDAIAFVSNAELADPRVLARAVAPLQGDHNPRHGSPRHGSPIHGNSIQCSPMQSQLANVRHGLDRLDVYRLSRIPSQQLMAVLQQEESLSTLQSLEAFLRSLSRAADAFEVLSLPEPHIRDYLRHLCAMPDWQEMGHLVRVLEAAVRGAVSGAASAARRHPPHDPPPDPT